jgi:hypothetical protein
MAYTALTLLEFLKEIVNAVGGGAPNRGVRIIRITIKY